ncbi:N-formylglutamate amidohydrolase [Sphingomonas sp. QA11]|uniref:N-formylglutamate amidohydrolase n=1 Tax=Sphingomonas sp. QA11 TaxID=2950605 RepID=UPI00234B0146|nr:N-formylglutamate amidohydrolase [Sphingomonas sp. QA11]WCM25421.1 N-formylglutamate amidohydrolase [Sphingomonas sp. QA11]
MADSALSFDRYGPHDPTSPIILSVPHAGRDYPLALRAALRVPVAALTPLEDRHIDAVAILARGNETMLVQRVARAWIDLNRSEQERDPGIDDGADRQAMPQQSARMRGGLGLVPRRVSGAGDIWRRRLDGDEVMARIEMDHRPYHAALTEALKRARSRFGIAILLDLHSMPPLTPAQGAARIVLGDRFGRSAAARFVRRLESEARSAGIATALNAPYAGGHILDAQARPRAGIHAIQIEFDRSLYLDPALDGPGDGMTAIATLLRRMIDAVTDEALALPGAIAAE